MASSGFAPAAPHPPRVQLGQLPAPRAALRQPQSLGLLGAIRSQPWCCCQPLSVPCVPCVRRAGADPREHVPDGGDQPGPGQWPRAGGDGPGGHQDSGHCRHHGRAGGGGGDPGSVIAPPRLFLPFERLSRDEIRWHWSLPALEKNGKVSLIFFPFFFFPFWFFNEKSRKKKKKKRKQNESWQRMFV